MLIPPLNSDLYRQVLSNRGYCCHNLFMFMLKERIVK